MGEEDALVEAIEGAALERDGRRTLRCGDAFVIARRHRVQVQEIGEICDRLAIKIVECQLGCFR